MSVNETEEDETEEHREDEHEGPRTLADVHCILATNERPSPRYGEEVEAVFDMDVLNEYVYDELLDALRHNHGYDLVAFGVLDEADLEVFELEEEHLHQPKAVFVYRGVGEE